MKTKKDKSAMRIKRDKNFISYFNPVTGFYFRTGILEDGKDTGIDPFMASFPELLDVGIMGHCIHGKTGLCQKAGIGCYQDGLHSNNPNMSLEDFKKLAEQCKGKTFQFALGGCGDPDQHEHFEEILKVCKENDIVPNFTTSGFGMTETLAKLCKQYCGAVAVSWCRSPYTIKAINLLLADGVKTNIHYVLSKSTLTEALQHLRRDELNGSIDRDKFSSPKGTSSKSTTEVRTCALAQSSSQSELLHNTSQSDLLNGRYDSTELRYFPKGINAVIFLLHKPVGLGTKEDMITKDNKDFLDFLDLVNEGEFPYKIGFDSCTVPALINLDKVEPNCLDTCEGARWSAYITPDMKLLPCSFDNQAQRWAVDLVHNTIAEAWESDTFEDFRNHFVQSCPSCKHRTKCMGGCPIVPEIVLCKDRESEN